MNEFQFPGMESLAVKRDLTEAERTLAGVRERIAGLEALRDARAQLEENLERATEAVARAREEHGAAEGKASSAENALGPTKPVRRTWAPAFTRFSAAWIPAPWAST